MSANMDTDQLIEWLEGKGVRQRILDKLREEEYDGTSFCMATEEELAALGSPRLKKGPLTKLLGFRDELKSSGANSTEEKKKPPPSVPDSQPKPVAPVASNPSRAHIPPNQSGKNSPWYKEVRRNLTAISDAIRLTPSALNALSTKFAEKDWIRVGDRLTADQIGTTALGRIGLDANQFWEFVDVLKSTEGMDIIANTLETNITAATGTVSPDESSGTGSSGAGASSRAPGATNMSHPILRERPTLQLINLIRYRRGSEEKSLRLIKQIAPHWQDVARALGYSPADINIIAKSHVQDPVEAAYSVLTQWMGRDTEHSWAKLIGVLREAAEELNAVASDLHFALIHRL